MNRTSGKKPSRVVSEGALLLMTLLWGATFVIVKESLHDISSMLFIAARFGIASIILSVIFLLKKRKIIRDAVSPGIFLGVLLFISFKMYCYDFFLGIYYPNFLHASFQKFW